ncbi:tRNA pseudouridine(55) synthase TruB, partial [bacterium]|nr:tRNA pseudouridine(55) synthase TruB [bacterium]
MIFYSDFHGIINLYKPVGVTSTDCTNWVKRLLKIKKVGHGGTLDPFAEGVLPIGINKGTKLLE